MNKHTGRYPAHGGAWKTHLPGCPFLAPGGVQPSLVFAVPRGLAMHLRPEQVQSESFPGITADPGDTPPSRGWGSCAGTSRGGGGVLPSGQEGGWCSQEGQGISLSPWSLQKARANHMAGPNYTGCDESPVSAS